MLVELDVFSGRPNPRWELDEATSAALRQLVRGLVPPASGLRSRPVSATEASSSPTRPGPTRAYKRYVIGSAVVLADPSFSVERFLLDHLPEEFRRLVG